MNYHCTTNYFKILQISKEKLYWINSNWNIKSAQYNGSDENTILLTNTTRYYQAIWVSGRVIYYAYQSQLLLINETQGSMPIVLYNDTDIIWGIFEFKELSMYSTIYEDVVLKTNKYMCYMLNNHTNMPWMLFVFLSDKTLYSTLEHNYNFKIRIIINNMNNIVFTSVNKHQIHIFSKYLICKNIGVLLSIGVWLLFLLLFAKNSHFNIYNRREKLLILKGIIEGKISNFDIFNIRQKLVNYNLVMKLKVLQPQFNFQIFNCQYC